MLQLVIGRLWGDLGRRSDSVKLLGGQLSIKWAGGEQDSVWMTGAASYVFEGRITV